MGPVITICRCRFNHCIVSPKKEKKEKNANKENNTKQINRRTRPLHPQKTSLFYQINDAKCASISELTNQLYKKLGTVKILDHNRILQKRWSSILTRNMFMYIFVNVCASLAPSSYMCIYMCTFFFIFFFQWEHKQIVSSLTPTVHFSSRPTNLQNITAKLMMMINNYTEPRLIVIVFFLKINSKKKEKKSWSAN